MPTERKVVLITGASSGIGAACATHLAGLGYRVYGTSRRPRPEITAYEMLQMDVQDDAAVAAGVRQILEREGRIDVVLNNAGISYGGSIEDVSPQEAHDQMETNFFGVLRVSQAVLPTMRAQRSGLIINVSSIAGRIALPFQTLYSASKFAVEGLTESLRMEVKAFGIHVVLLEPGDLRTELTDHRKHAAAALTNPAYQGQYQLAAERAASDERNGGDPILAARMVARIIATPRPRLRYVVGPVYESGALFLRWLLPHRIFEWAMMKYYRVDPKNYSL